MSKKKNAELSRMWGFAGKRHWLTIASCILAGISTVLSICLYLVCDSGYLVCDEKGRFVTGSFQWALCVVCSSIFVT